VKKVAVYIGTTGGPVRVEYIINEAAELTEVFKGRDFVPLMPISDDYENFVKPGRPVYRAFGPFTNPSFRMDVSGNIKSGKSWGLAVFLAHGLSKQSRLASPGEEPRLVVWATGQVDVDFVIGGVEHIEEKLKASRELFSSCFEKRVPVLVFLPQADASGDADIHGVTIKRAESALNVLEELEIVCNEEAARPLLKNGTSQARKTASPKLSTFLWVGVITVAIIAAFMAFKIQRNESFLARLAAPKITQSAKQNIPLKTKTIKPELVDKPVSSVITLSSEKIPITVPAHKPSIAIFERRPFPGKSCADVHFGGAETRELLVKAFDGKTLPPSSLNGLCGLHILVDAGRSTIKGEGILEVLSGRYVGQSENRRTVIFSGKTSWVLDLPRRMNQPLIIAIRYRSKKTSTGKFESLNVKHTVKP